MKPRNPKRSDAWFQMHEFPILLSENDRTRAERVARIARSKDSAEVRIAERFQIDGAKVYDVLVIWNSNEVLNRETLFKRSAAEKLRQ